MKYNIYMLFDVKQILFFLILLFVISSEGKIEISKRLYGGDKEA